MGTLAIGSARYASRRGSLTDPATPEPSSAAWMPTTIPASIGNLARIRNSISKRAFVSPEADLVECGGNQGAAADGAVA